MGFCGCGIRAWSGEIVMLMAAQNDISSEILGCQGVLLTGGKQGEQI